MELRYLKIGLLLEAARLSEEDVQWHLRREVQNVDVVLQRDLRGRPQILSKSEGQEDGERSILYLDLCGGGAL